MPRSPSLIRDMEIDIAVDLKGFTGDSPPGHPGVASGAGAGELSGLSRHHGRGLHRLHHRRPLSSFRRVTARSYGEKVVLPARQLRGQRSEAPDRGADADPRGGRAARNRFRVLLVQQQLQDHAGHLRHLDAAAARGRRQRAVAAGHRRCRRGQSAARGGGAGCVARPAGVRAARRRSRTIWRAIAWPICSSTRCRTTRTRRRATRCGPGCRW